MEKQLTGPSYQKGDKLDLFLLSLVTLFVSLLTFSNVSIPSLTDVDSSKYGVTFFNLDSFSYFKELPLNLIHSVGIGVAAIVLIFALMIRRRKKNFVPTVQRVIFFIFALIVIVGYAVNALLLAPKAGSVSAKMILLGQSAADRVTYTINISRYTMPYRMSFVFSTATFVLYIYFLLMYLRTFNYCASSFIRMMQRLAVLICALGFLGVFFNSTSQDTIINNFKALMNPSLTVKEVYHPIISNSLLGAFTFLGCVTSLIMFYKKPSFITYIVAGGFSFCSYLTGNVYGLFLTLVAIAITSIALLFNMRKHKFVSLVTLFMTLGIVAFIGLSITVLKGMFPSVNQLFVNYIPRLKRRLNADIYIWKVVFSAAAFYAYGFIGFTPAVATPVIYEVSNLYGVRFAPYGTSNNAYVQMAANYGYIGIGLMFIGYVIVILRCFGMLKKKKKAGFYYLLMLLLIIFASLFNENGLFSISPLAMLYLIVFIYPLSSEYHRGIIKQGSGAPEPQEIKEVEHKYVRYDVQADDINQNKNPESSGNMNYQDAEYQEDRRVPEQPPQVKRDERYQQSNLPSYDEEDEYEDLDSKKKNKRKLRRLVKKSKRKDPDDEIDYENEEEFSNSQKSEGKVNEKLENGVSQRVYDVPEENIRTAKRQEVNQQPPIQHQEPEQPKQPISEAKPAPKPRPAPDVVNMKEHPSSHISEYDEKPEQNDMDEEYEEDVVEKQIHRRDEPIKAHYRNDNKKINLSMTSPKIDMPMGKVVSRRSGVDYEDSYEIIEGRSDLIKDDHIVKPKPRVIMDYDKFNDNRTEFINKGKNEINSQKEAKILFDFNKDKQKEKQEVKISSSIDNILHNSTPPPKPKTSGNISGFDSLLSAASRDSISIDEFKKQNAKAKEELEAYKKMKNFTPQGEIPVEQKPDIASTLGSFDNIVTNKGGIHPDSPGTNIEGLDDLRDVKENRKNIKVKVFRQDDSDGEVIKRRMFDGLL